MNTLKDNLNKLGIDETQLSNRELTFITKIQEFFDSVYERNEELKKEIQVNKFNRSLIQSKGICSRQTLYTNEIINNYVSYLVSQAESFSVVDETKYVSKDKYSELKNENALLISNAVDIAIKESEVERLTAENKRLQERIDGLIKRLEEERSKVISFKNQYS